MDNSGYLSSLGVYLQAIFFIFSKKSFFGPWGVFEIPKILQFGIKNFFFTKFFLTQTRFILRVTPCVQKEKLGLKNRTQNSLEFFGFLITIQYKLSEKRCVEGK